MILSRQEPRNTFTLVRRNNATYLLSSQVLTYLGANVNQTAETNRTLWPLTGGSLALDLHHPWTYVFVNLALGTISASFNISLTQQPLNETGNGTLCLPELTLPPGFTPTEGQNASLQVVTLGQTGSALYNVSPQKQWFGAFHHG